jgi:hypothetical protein
MGGGYGRGGGYGGPCDLGFPPSALENWSP